MNFNEYVKGKRFNDLSTDGYDWTKWCSDNNAELERRIAASGLENCERNGRILAEYALENNILVSMDDLFGVLRDARYNGRFVRVPPPPPAPVIAPTVASLGYTRKKLAHLGPAEMKTLLRNSAIGDYDEVQRQVNEILSTPATGEGFKGGVDDKLYQLGIHREQGHSNEKTNQPTDEQRRAHNLSLRQREWDEANRKIESISIQQPGSGRHNFAASDNAKKISRQKLGPRP